MERQERQNATTRFATLLPVGICGAALLLGLAQPAAAEAREMSRDQWMARVANSLNANIRSIDGVPQAVRQNAAAIVAVTFDADGKCRGATLARPTGNAVLDREAMRAVSKVNFPQMPQALRGTARTVAMEVFFGDPSLNPERAKIRNTSTKVARGHVKSNPDSLNS